jgi:hypothetical protein
MVIIKTELKIATGFFEIKENGKPIIDWVNKVSDKNMVFV